MNPEEQIESNMVDQMATGIKRVADPVELPKIIKKARKGTFASIDIVEDFDVVEDNLVNLIPLFKAVDWKVKIKDGIFDLILACIHKAIATKQCVSEFATCMMYPANPFLSGLSYEELYALFWAVLTNLTAIYVCVVNARLYYELMVDFCDIMKPKNSATLHAKEKNKYGNLSQVKTYLCNLKSTRGCQFKVKNNEGGKDLTKMALELQLTDEANSFLHAWNWIARDFLVVTFYTGDVKLCNDYVAKLADRQPSMWKRRFFGGLTFEEIWDAYVAKVIKWTGKHDKTILPAEFQFPPNSLSEITMWRTANFRKPKLSPIPVKDGEIPNPKKNYLVVPTVELEELPELSDNPTEEERAAFKAIQEEHRKGMETMKCFLRADFWNKCPTNEPGYYSAKYYYDFSTEFVDPTNPTLRHIADISPDEFSYRSENVSAEIKKIMFDKFHVVEEETTGPSKFNDGKMRKIVKIKFDATKEKEKRSEKAPNVPVYEKGFLHDCMFTVAMTPAVGVSTNNFNNKLFDNKLFWVAVLPESDNQSSDKKAGDDVIF